MTDLLTALRELAPILFVVAVLTITAFMLAVSEKFREDV